MILRHLQPCPALLLAGLFLLGGQAQAAGPEEIPSRRVAPTAEPSPTSTPEVRASDLQALGEGLRKDLKLQDQAAKAFLTGMDKELRGLLERESAASRQRTEKLSATAQALEEGLGKALGGLQSLVAAVDALQKGQDQQVAGMILLRKDLEATDKASAADRADMQALRKDLAARAQKLESLTDLLSVMRKDLESVGEELVEVKQELKKMQAGPEAFSGEWLDQVARWKYWPAVAVVLSGAALGVAYAR